MGPEIDRNSIKGGKIEDGMREIENASFPETTDNLLLHFGTNNLSDRADNEDDLIDAIVEKYKKLIDPALKKRVGTRA